MSKKKILALCTGNSCRSQMLEGYLKHFAKDRVEAYSAGIETHGVNPLAVATMREDGIDISSQTSNNVNEYASIHFDYIITVCDHARESCPYFPSQALRLHQNFPDPAKFTGTASAVAAQFALVRDKIKEYCRDFVERNV